MAQLRQYERFEEPPSGTTEAEFQKAVMKLFRARKWRVHHSAARPARQGRYITSGSPGFPDIVAIRPPDLLFLELKNVGASKARKDAEEQRVWIGGLQACGAAAFVVDQGAWPMLIAIARDGLKTLDDEKENEGMSHVKVYDDQRRCEGCGELIPTGPMHTSLKANAAGDGSEITYYHQEHCPDPRCKPSTTEE